MSPPPGSFPRHQPTACFHQLFLVIKSQLSCCGFESAAFACAYVDVCGPLSYQADSLRAWVCTLQGWAHGNLWFLNESSHHRPRSWQEMPVFGPCPRFAALEIQGLGPSKLLVLKLLG